MRAVNVQSARALHPFVTFLMPKIRQRSRFCRGALSTAEEETEARPSVQHHFFLDPAVCETRMRDRRANGVRERQGEASSSCE